MKRFYDVTAGAFDPVTGESIAPARTERVDVRANPIFQKCDTVLQIHDVYEAFWNRLNSTPTEVVFVSSVREVK